MNAIIPNLTLLCRDKTVCFLVSNECISIISVAHLNRVNYDRPHMDLRDIALFMIQVMKEYNVDHIQSDALLPGLCDMMKKFQTAVHIIEDIMVSPYTYLGKKRLTKEFELIIEDDASCV